MRLFSASITALALCAATSAGCGYSEQQWQVQIDKYEHERTRRDAAEDRVAKADAELEEVRTRGGALEERLASAGIDVERLSDGGGAGASVEERERAVAEMKARNARLDAIRGRFETLRGKVTALAVPGAAVTIRKNRVIVTLPGDAMFDGSKDAIKKSGREALKKLAEGIKSEPNLVTREYQVAAHTDSKKPSGGAFSDNLGLSAMRARAVVLFLTDPAAGDLAHERWSAAGYADAEPVAPNGSDDGRAANRRIEIVVMPSADELVDLRSIAAAQPPPSAVAAPPPAPKDGAPKAPKDPAKADAGTKKDPAPKKAPSAN